MVGYIVLTLWHNYQQSPTVDVPSWEFVAFPTKPPSFQPVKVVFFSPFPVTSYDAVFSQVWRAKVVCTECISTFNSWVKVGVGCRKLKGGDVPFLTARSASQTFRFIIYYHRNPYRAAVPYPLRFKWWKKKVGLSLCLHTPPGITILPTQTMHS